MYTNIRAHTIIYIYIYVFVCSCVYVVYQCLVTYMHTLCVSVVYIYMITDILGYDVIMNLQRGCVTRWRMF